MRTANPALNEEAFQGERVLAAGEAMSVQGTVVNAFWMLVVLLAATSLVWSRAMAAGAAPGLTLVGALAGFVVAMITIFKKAWAPITAPLYAVCEGLFLGGISAVLETAYHGIVIQAVLLTFGTLAALLVAYRAHLITVTDKFRMGIVAATGGIALVYLASLVLGFFGVRIPLLFASGPVGIGFSLVVVVIAALNLVLDFDLIERAVRAGAPKYMEWYAAFGLMVTMVWLYIEILRLLSLFRQRR